MRRGATRWHCGDPGRNHDLRVNLDRGPKKHHIQMDWRRIHPPMSGVVAEGDIGRAEGGLVLNDIAGDSPLRVEADADLGDSVNTGLLGGCEKLEQLLGLTPTLDVGHPSPLYGQTEWHADKAEACDARVHHKRPLGRPFHRRYVDLNSGCPRGLPWLTRPDLPVRSPPLDAGRQFGAPREVICIRLPAVIRSAKSSTIGLMPKKSARMSPSTRASSTMPVAEIMRAPRRDAARRAWV